MFDKNQKYKIIQVINNSTKCLDDKYFYRIGRICYLSKSLEVGTPTMWLYENSIFCKSSEVVRITKNKNKVEVETKHRTYTFALI